MVWCGAVALLAAAVLTLGGCATSEYGGGDGGPPARLVIVSVRDQKMTVVRTDGTRIVYPISTSKFGLGDHRRHYETPTGNLAVAQKIGGGAPLGAVFKSRVRTGEIVKVNAPGRDPIVTRILALRGLDPGNRDALSRGIYIHGTPQENLIGTPASYGCIRMRSRDVIQLYDMVNVGTKVQILDSTRSEALSAYNSTVPREPAASAAPPSSSVAVTGGASPADEAAAATEHNHNAPSSATANPTPAHRSTGPTVVTSTTRRNDWAGSPSRLLTDRPTTASTPPATRGGNSVGKPRPATNNEESDTGDGRGSNARSLKRSALDSL
ncbi:MAG: L,D-transpeptidase [Verrucomicrobia bacterium]|nr:L,D-transpeptidase [Verrucomicrobiota bacterium]MBV9658543.1 L,D-transpeptidase [Verrucomicrobiota bacterium]